MTHPPFARLCVLFNPSAGSAGQIDALKAALAGRPGVEFRATTDAADLKAQAATAAAAGFALAVCGGDGTVHAVVNALAPTFPPVPLLVVPFGTGNDLARTLGIPLDPAAAAALLKKPRVKRIDAVRVAGDWTGYFVNAATGGFSGRVAEGTTSEVKQSWGPLAYLRGAAGPVADPPTFHLTLRFDDGPPIQVAALNVVVANARTAAGGLAVAPRANVEDGKLEVVVVKAGEFLDRAVVAARLLAGDYHRDEVVARRKARRVELTSEEDLPLSFDGELTAGRHFTFAVVPRAVHAVVGPGYRKRPGGVRAILFGMLAAALALVRRSGRAFAVGVPLAVASVAGFAFLASVTDAADWRAANTRIMTAFHTRRTPALDALAIFLAQLGSGWGTALMTAAVVIPLAFRKRFLDAATLVAVAAGAGVLIEVLKGAFALARPAVFEHVYPADGTSFPSGHALMATALYGSLAYLVVAANRVQLWRWLVAAACLTVAAGICWSRPYLGVHWPTDVAAGAFVGTAWATCGLLARAAARAAAQRRATL